MHEEQHRARELAIRGRLKEDFEYYAPRCLRIVTKPDMHGKREVVPFRFNTAQRYVHKRIEEQRSQKGWVRAIVLKGRQQGVSTYTEGRFYWKTTNGIGEKTFILTHAQAATDNLFAMVERYHEHAPVHVKPFVSRSNAKALKFGRLDSEYQVATAGSKGAGRSATLINVHGSEVAFWENAQDHLSGMLQAVPLARGTEVILESTANGVGNVFHSQWLAAERGESDFIPIFVPWFWQEEYKRPVPDDFEVATDPESVPEGELTEGEYQEAFKLSDGQMYWRRRKIVELGGGETGFWEFKKEYPATADEAFTATSSHSFLSRRYVLKARKSTVATAGRLIIGVDPGGEEEGNDRSAIIRRRTRRLFDPQTFTTLNTMQLAALVWRIIKKEKPVKVFVDVGGKGKGVVDRLFELEGTAGIVVPVNFGESALDPEAYVNRKAEMAWTLKDWIEDPGGANIPDDDVVQADFLASVADDPDSNQRRRLKSKRWMRSKGLRSPDIFDAAILTFAAPIDDLIAFQSNTATDFDPLDGSLSNFGSIGNAMTEFDPT